jgi:hypothetical protein
VAPEAINAEPLRLAGLEYLSEFNGCSFADLPGRLQTRIEETELVVVLIRRGTPEEVKFNIFARINTGGRPLTRQELRHALIPGPARTFLADLASSEDFRSATGGSVSPDRMSDREMCLRFCAFWITPPDEYPSGDFDGFLRKTMHQINSLDATKRNELRAHFLRAMSASQAVLGSHAFRKRFRGVSRRSPVNKALFEAQSVTLSGYTGKEVAKLIAHRDHVEAAFLHLMDSTDFVTAVSAGTGDIGKVRLRFRMLDEMFREVLNA